MDNGWMLWIGLILLITVLGPALTLIRLRSGTAQQFRRRTELMPRARKLNQEFSGLVRRQPANPGEPYASRLAQASQGLRRGWDRVRQIEAQLREPPIPIPAQPVWKLLGLIPLYRELIARLRAWRELTRLEAQLNRAEEEWNEASRQLAEIANLGKHEQSELDRLQAEVKNLREELAAHRLVAALASEQEKLNGLTGRLEQAATRLGSGEPAPAQVAEIHPERRQIEQELQAIRQALHGHEASQTKLRPRLDRQRARLETFEQALSEEEKQHPAPLLRERYTVARQTLTQLEEALSGGDYAAIEPGLVDLAARQKELEEILKKLAGLRDRLAAAQDQTGAALSSLRQWMRQFPAPFILDVAQEQARTLQTRLQEQARAANSEDLAEIERACQVNLGDIRKAQVSFERNLETYQRVVPQLSPELIEGLQKRGEHLIARLKLRHPNYHEKARLATMEDNATRLAESWKLIGTGDPNRQSDLAQLGQALQQLESAWNGLERGTQRAFEVLEQIKVQQEQATVRLGEGVFNELVALVEANDPEWAPLANELLERRQPLLERAGRGDEDFSLLLNESETLYKEALKTIKDYQFRLARAQAETARLVELLNGCADRLEPLLAHPYLDFKERIGEPLNATRRWLGQAQTPGTNLLARWDDLAASGAELHPEIDGLCRAVEAEAATAGQDRAWTEDMLATAEELLGSARQQQPSNTFSGELAAARNALEMARRKLSALAAPRRKYLLPEYQAELDDVRQIISGGRAHIDNMLG
jgi:septation ring formation regulator EzrA